MKYDPSYEYSGSEKHPLATTTDSLYFAIRCILNGRSHLASGAPKTAQFDQYCDDRLAAEGWSIIDTPPPVRGGQDKTLACIDNEGRGLVVSPIMFSNDDHYKYVVTNLPKMLASIG